MAAVDEFGQFEPPRVHRLTLAAQSFVALLLGRHTHAEFVEGFGKGQFLRAESGRCFLGGGAVALVLVQRAAGFLQTLRHGADLLAGGLALARGLYLLTLEVVAARVQVTRLAFQQGVLALQGGGLQLAGLQRGARVVQRSGGGLHPRG